MTENLCYQPTKFYLDCKQIKTNSDSIQFCQDHEMMMLNLTNGTLTLLNDVALLNATFQQMNCTGNFWYASSSSTNLVGNTNNLDGLLSKITNLLNIVTCLIPLLCPTTTTTTTPITHAFTICTRSTSFHFINKCFISSQRSDIKQYKFYEEIGSAGIFDRFSSSSRLTCSSLCSSNDSCIGMSYNNGTCTLYM